MTTSKFDRHIFCIDGKGQIEGTSGGIDMYGADNVEVQIDYERQKLWVNANGECKLRIHDIEFIDLRRKTDDVELYERGLANLKRIEAERAAEKIAQDELARIVRNHAASRTSKQGCCSPHQR
jgi:rubrerythrin